ncbi:MAG: Asp-tRNA(Asn)/Glu-tRNA(Gln) amidotransferase GatCAB subunit B, partial [Planctomycetaceae bacterium]
ETSRKLGDPGVTKETRGWNADRGATFAQRGKEEASDYRYFPDPDLAPVTVSPEFIERVRAELCEFPADRRSRLCNAYELSAAAAAVIVDRGRAFADYFEDVAKACASGKTAANWVTQDVMRTLNERSVSIEEFPITADVLGDLLRRIAAGEITTKSARDVFAALLAESAAGRSLRRRRVAEIIAERNLARVQDTGELETVIAAVIERNSKVAEDVRGGKTAAVGPLIGQVMKQVRGADPKAVRRMLLEKIRA